MVLELIRCSVPPKKQSFGVGIKMLLYKDEVFLLNLHKKNACPSLQSYKNLLQIHHRMIVSKSTLHRWFHNRFPYKGKYSAGVEDAMAMLFPSI
eukprot:2710704-Ditylum_brightwellii.AAC.1